jgi:hypothetical protein
MINQLVVLNTVQANGADAFVDNQGNFNVNGIGALPAASVSDVVKIPSSAEQIKKQLITCTSSNSSTYTFVINGYAMSTGLPSVKTVTWTSPAVSTTALVSAGITATVNAISDFNVTATDTGSGVVSFIAKTATAACPFAPMFNLQNADTKITVTAVAATTFTAAPTGGRTATGYAIIADGGTVTSIVVTDPGMGYIAAPAIAVTGGGGTLGAATTIIFEGEVVGVAAPTAGSGYTCREGYQVVGTPAALIAKYSYVASTPNAPGAPAYPALANLTSGYTYTEWIVSFQVGQPGGITTFAQTVTTGQISILVYESATNAATLNSAYGTLNNLRKGYRASFEALKAINGTSDVVATTFVVATGLFTLDAATCNGIKADDLLLIGTAPVFPNTAANAIAKVVGVPTNATILAQIGGANLATAFSGVTLAASVVKRAPISK